MDEWKDIESAPKDGKRTPVLISVGDTVGEAYYRAEGDFDDGWWWANTDPSDYYACKIDREPDGWMPLPSPSVPGIGGGE